MVRTSRAVSLLLVVWLVVGCAGASTTAQPAAEMTAQPAATTQPTAAETTQPAAATTVSDVMAAAQPAADELQGTIEIVGSTTVVPLVEKLREVFVQKYPGITVNVGAGGSVVGIEAVQDGRTDIGMSSREVRPEEMREGMKRHQIAIDVLAVIVHPTNPVTDLSKEQLQDIFTGKITNWSEVGGPDLEILPVLREITSGTRGAFDDIALEGAEPTENADVQITASEVEAKVASTENAIGYIGFGHINENEIKILSINGVDPSQETALDGSYILLRPLLLLTGPLSRDIADVFVEFALSEEGQKIVEDDGWVPVAGS